jgi:hypothetical protein
MAEEDQYARKVLFLAYSRASTLLGHIAFACCATIGETPNSAGSLESDLNSCLPSPKQLRLAKEPLDGTTTMRGAFFVQHQTGRYGPQNGWRIVSVQAGNLPSQVERIVQEMGGIEPDTAEMVYFPANGGEVARYKDTEEVGTTRRAIQHILASSFFDTIDITEPWDITRYIRMNGCYPLYSKRSPVISTEPSTGTGLIFILKRSDTKSQSVGVGILVKKGHSPESVERTILGAFDEGKVEDGDFVVFGMEHEGLVLFQGRTGMKIAVSVTGLEVV